MVLECGLAVDVDGRADLGSDSANICVLSKKSAILIIKVIHMVILSSGQTVKSGQFDDAVSRQYKGFVADCNRAFGLG